MSKVLGSCIVIGTIILFGFGIKDAIDKTKQKTQCQLAGGMNVRLDDDSRICIDAKQIKEIKYVK